MSAALRESPVASRAAAATNLAAICFPPASSDAGDGVVAAARRAVLRVAAALTSIIATAFVPTAAAQAPNPFPPFTVGPFPAACANVDQDFSRMQPGETPEQYWEGEPRGGDTRYVTSLFRDPAAAMQFSARVPDDRGLFPRFANASVPYALLVCYPTDSTNARTDYVLPNGVVVPRMQRGTEPPIWPESFAAARLPLLIYAHGLAGSPLERDYLQTASLLATWGWIVAVPFFGDARFSDVKISDLGDVGTLITKFDRVVETQAVRAIAASQTIDYLLAHPFFRDRIDANRVGGFGASLGGETVLLVAGAKLTTSLLGSSRQVIRDSRLKAAVGYVPYFGQPVLPAFGSNLSGLDAVTMPFLGIGGTADFTAPLSMIEAGMNRMAGSRILVAFQGGQHGLDPVALPDVATWSVLFLDGFVNQNPVSRARVQSMTSVAGGAQDSTRIDHVSPLPATGLERDVVEYYNGRLDHYFITAEAAEAALLDAGVVVPGWQRTGLVFKEFVRGSGTGNDVCRFFGSGPNSHFFTASPYECAVLHTPPWNAVWADEGIAFNAPLPVAERCPDGRIPVYRIYNQSKGGMPNHRYTPSRSAVAAMQGQGWLLEGAVFCAAP